MRSLILGTAGHIDHGKTELVRALTGVDTDRLKEEKERGITIDLGFAELPGSDVRLGVVDVPGHEGFVRNMLAGATGMDVVVLVVAADEGVMPQTREHLAIVSLLGVQRLVVALTKADLVEKEWLALVRDEVRETLAPTPFAEAPMVATSVRTGQGIDDLRTVLLESGADSDPGDPDDVTALPVDRAFTVRGTGTVVTGTLWSGRVGTGDRVRLLPDGLAGRVRGLQVHGRDVDEAVAGERTAVALAGDAMDLEHVRRGQTLVVDSLWPPSRMLTVRFSLLPDTEWELAHNQRVRVHLGTAEVMARCVLFQDEPLAAGEVAWGQLRLEEPAAARARQPLVLRSYSPVMTIGGARVVEPLPPKRGQAGREVLDDFARILEGSPGDAVAAVVRQAGWEGAEAGLLPVTSGLAPAQVEEGVSAVEIQGGLCTAQGRLVSPEVVASARASLLGEVDAVHGAEPYRPGVPVEVLRDGLPGEAAPGLADEVLARLGAEGALDVSQGMVARTGFRPRLTPAQQALEEELADRYRGAGLETLAVDDLPAHLREDPAFWTLLRRLEDQGRLVPLEEGLFIWAEALQAASDAVRTQLAGREGLGPADFKDAVPVSRRHLLPILAFFDRTGVTRRDVKGRSVPE